jgi:hypothetical protein
MEDHGSLMENCVRAVGLLAWWRLNPRTGRHYAGAGTADE